MKNKIIGASLRILTLLFLIFWPFNSYAQLYFQTDSIKLTTISDFPENYMSGYVYRGDFEEILIYGPSISIYGKLINPSQAGIVYDASYEDNISKEESDILIEPIIKTNFIYKGHKYETEHEVAFFSDLFIPRFEKLLTCKVGKNTVNMFYIPGNTSICFSFGSSFLYTSKWCKFRNRRTMREFTEQDYKNYKKLEKIAKEVLPTIQISIEVKTHLNELSQLLIDSIKTETNRFKDGIKEQTFELEPLLKIDDEEDYDFIKK